MHATYRHTDRKKEGHWAPWRRAPGQPAEAHERACMPKHPVIAKTVLCLRYCVKKNWDRTANSPKWR